MAEFTKEELERYSRQILLFGRAGQSKLKNAKVGILGLGGLGNPALLYLAASGIGYLRVADFDIVERHNLSRQILFTEKDCGQEKTILAKEKILEMNPNTKIDIYGKITVENIKEFSEDLNIILEGSDDLSLKFFCNDFCYKNNIPLVIGALGPEQGHVFPIFPGGACYRCVFWDLPYEEIPTCASAGVISPMAGVLGTMMALLTVEFLAQGIIPKNLLLVENTKWRSLPLRLNPQCKNH